MNPVFPSPLPFLQDRTRHVGSAGSGKANLAGRARMMGSCRDLKAEGNNLSPFPNTETSYMLKSILMKWYLINVSTRGLFVSGAKDSLRNAALLREERAKTKAWSLKHGPVLRGTDN